MTHVPDQFGETLRNITDAYEAHRHVETMQQLSPLDFGVMLGMDEVGNAPTPDQIDTAIDNHITLLDAWDDNARRAFGEVNGYNLRQVESGRLAIAQRLGESSVWGPGLRETILTAELTPALGKLVLNKGVQVGKEYYEEKVEKEDVQTLTTSLLTLLKVIGDFGQR